MFPMTCLIGVDGLFLTEFVCTKKDNIFRKKGVLPVGSAIGEIAVWDSDVVLIPAFVEAQRGLVAASELAVAFGSMTSVSNRQFVESLEVGIRCGVPGFIMELPNHGNFN